MPSYTIVSPKTGNSYNVEIDREPTAEDIDSIWPQLDAQAAPAEVENTGQGRFSSAMSNLGRGALSIIPGAIGGIGYLAEPVIGPGLKEVGEGIEQDIEKMLPVNPAYQDEFSQKAAGAVGQAIGMLGTGGVAGALGKGAAVARGLGAAEAAAAGTQLAGRTLLGSGFLSGSREGGQAAERYGMEGVSAYTRALLGGAIEGATEKYLFGLGTELAPVKKFLGDTLEKGVGGIAKMGATEAGEEAAAQAGGNIATKVLAPEGVETPGIGSGVGEAAALGGVAGLALGGVTGLLPSGEKAEPATAAESVTVESGESPLPTVLKTLDEKVKAAVEANADVLPATAAALKDLESGLTDVGEVEGDVRQGLPIRRGIATPGQEGVADLGAPEGDVLSLVPKKSPAATPAEPTDATEGQTPTPGGVGAPPVVTNEPQTPSPAEQPVSAAETPVATEPEAPLPETEKVFAPKAEPGQGAGMTQRDTSKEEKQRKSFLSDLQFYGTARIGEDQYSIKQASDDTFYLEKTSAGQRSIVASGFPDIETAQKSAGELVQPVSEEATSTGQQAAPTEVSPQERGASVETIASGGGMSVEEARQFLARKSDTGEPLIFGRLFSEIAGMQQNERPRVLRTPDKLKAAKQIAGDIVKFKIPVAQEVVDTYGITLPEGYARQGDLYVFAPEAPTTQTETQPKPEDASKNQVEETGGTPPVESQPPQTRPEGEAQEGASQRSREGEEGVLTPEKAAPGVEPGAAALDAEYLAAVETGDTKKVQSMVNEAAKNAGVIEDALYLFHGGNKIKKSFEAGPSRSGIPNAAAYLTDTKRVAWKYALGGGITDGMSLSDYRRKQLQQLPNREPTVQKLFLFGNVADFSSWKDRITSSKLLEVFGEDRMRDILDEFSADYRQMLEDGDSVESVLDSALKEGGWVQEDTDATSNIPELQFVIASGLLDEYLKHYQKDIIAYDDAEAGGKTYVALNPNQIKSADPVTYDDAGNVIPLSQRFNPDTADIRGGGVTKPQTVSAAEFGSTNTIFTKEKAEEASKIIKRKLGQTNVPAFDPELFAAATNYAGFLIEGGVRKFGDFSSRMISEFGETVRPILKSVYSGIRELDIIEGMDDAATVSKVLAGETPVAAPAKAQPKAPTELAETPEQVGIANAAVDVAREALGLPPIERPVQEVYGDDQVWADAEAAMTAEPDRARYLVKSLIESPRQASTLETAILLRETVARTARLQQASIELVNATPENKESARQKYDDAVMALTEVQEASALAGAEQGRAFRARRFLADLNYNLAAMTTTLQGAHQRKLTDAEVAEVMAQSEKINKALKEVNDLKDSSGAVAEEESIFAEVVKEAKAEARLNAKEAISTAKSEIKSGKSVMEVINEKRDAARARLRKRGGSLNVGLNPADLVDYAIIAASYIAEGAVTLKDVTVKMVKEFGAAIEQHMPKIFSEAQVLKSGLDKAVVEEPLEGETKAKGKKPALEQIKESGEVSGRLIHDLVKEKVKSGLTTLDDVFKAVTKDVQTVIPEITERELRDMFSGYGKVKFPSQEELPKKVRELRRLAQLASAIEDAQKKIAPLRSGPQRDEASLAVREAQKELHRIMKEQGIERAPGPRALKSALDAAKTRLRNQIEELEKQVAERKRTPASKRDITYDAETNSLIEKRDALKKTLDEVDPVLPPTPQELIKNALKELDKTIAELERRVKERDVSEKPKTETPLTEQLQVKRDQRDALRKQLNDIRVEIEGEPYLTQEEINERAERRLVSEINEIERQIAEKDFTPEQARKPENTAALIRLKARRDVLREQFNALKEQTIGKKVKSEAERVEIAVKALDKSIDDLNARIAKGDVMPRPKADNVPKTPEILELRKERDGLRKTLQQMRKAQEEAAKDPVEEQIKRDRKYLETQIKNYEKKLASGDFRPRPKKAKEYDAKLAAETLKLRKLKEAWAEKVFTAQLNSRGPAAKAYDFGKQVLHTSRAVLTSFDVSAVFRQGGFIVLGNPIRAFKNLVPMFQSLASENAAEKTKNELEARPNFKLYQQSKLYLADFNQNNLNQQEELFMSRWLNKIPSYLLGGAIRGSQRAYVTFLNRLRADTFDAMLGSLQKGPTPTTEEINAISNYINIATGRGDLGKFQQAGEALNTVFFAAKLVTSRFQILGGLPFFKASGRTKNLVLREYAKFLTGAALVYALGMAFQDDDDEPLELDPRSSDFLKLRYGDTRVDPLGGLIQASVFLSRVVSGEKKQFSGKIVPLRDSYRLMNLFRENPRKDKVRYGADNTFDVGANFLRSKFSPSFGAAVDLITGETVIGEKTTPTEIGYRMVMPLTFGETQKTLEAQGMSKGSALTIVSLFGMGVQTYD